MSISIVEARSLSEGFYQGSINVNVNVNETSDRHKANVFFNLNTDKSASSFTNRISIKEERNLLL
jgi:hypothetical protein